MITKPNIRLLDIINMPPLEFRRFCVWRDFGPVKPESPEIWVEFGHHNAVWISVENHQMTFMPGRDEKRTIIGHGTLYLGGFSEEDMLIFRAFEQGTITGRMAGWFAENLWAKYDLWKPDGITRKFVSRKLLNTLQRSYSARHEDPTGSKARGDLSEEIFGDRTALDPG